MAVNPMQRRARNSFLLGFLLALVMMVIVVLYLVFKIKGLNEDIEMLKSKQQTIFVAREDMESGNDITMDMLDPGIVQTDMDTSNVISDDDFIEIDQAGNETEKEMVLKINVPQGAIITKDMIVEKGEETLDSDRIKEFNCIQLPSQLKNKDYIDIRLSLPTGQDFVVLSKKQVLGTTVSSIWLKLDELELELMNNAIVESYTITGSKLYAIEYAEAGLQAASTPTYVASADVFSLIVANPNIIDEAKLAYSDKVAKLSNFRSQSIEAEIDANRQSRPALVSQGNANEQQSVLAARQAYVDSLEGTSDIGYGAEN